MAKIDSWNLKRGFGFLTHEGRKVFVHVSTIHPQQEYGADLTGLDLDPVQIERDERGWHLRSGTVAGYRSKKIWQKLGPEQIKKFLTESGETASPREARRAVKALIGAADYLAHHSPCGGYIQDAAAHCSYSASGVFRGALAGLKEEARVSPETLETLHSWLFRIVQMYGGEEGRTRKKQDTSPPCRCCNE